MEQPTFDDLEAEAALEQERWLPVPDYEDLYEVSDLGRVRSLPRWTTSGLRGGKILKPQVTNDPGHLRVGLSRRSVIKQVTVHKLVLAAFVGPCPDGQEVRHLDGNPANNRLSNLAYGTKGENALDAVRHGTHYNAGKTHCDHGHEFTAANTYERPDRPGTRTCLQCQHDHNAAKNAARRAETAARRAKRDKVA